MLLLYTLPPRTRSSEDRATVPASTVGGIGADDGGVSGKSVGSTVDGGSVNYAAVGCAERGDGSGVVI